MLPPPHSAIPASAFLSLKHDGTHHRLNDYLLLFLIVLGINLLPAFGPPTWSIIVLYGLNSNLPVLAMVITGALAAASGRLMLAYAFRHLGKYLPQRQKNNLVAAKEMLEKKRHNMLLGLGLFALSPLPSAQLFEAAGLTGVRLLAFTAAFFCGRLVSYSIYAFSAKSIRHSSIGGAFAESFTSPFGIALQLAMIAFVILLTRIDWSRFSNHRENQGQQKDEAR